MSEKVSTGFLKQSLRGVLIAILISLAGVLIFSLVIRLALLNSGVIKAVNQFIKIMSVFLGCFFSLKENKGLLKGLIVGIIISTFLIYLIFALISGNSVFSLSFLIDLIFGIIVGGISGVIAVNVKR